MTVANNQTKALKECLTRLDGMIQHTLNTVRGAANKSLSLPPALFSRPELNISSSRDELERTYLYICEQIQRNKNDTILQYYCERFTEQYTAITRALEHLKRAKSKRHSQTANRYRKQVSTLLAPSHKLYQDLAQHHEYERRLMDMVRDKQIAIRSAVDPKSHTNEMLALQARLGRCRQAIARIEDAIKSVEQG